MGLAGPLGGRNTVVIQLDINVDATGPLHGSISNVHRMLRDRDTGQILGEVVNSGPFPYFGNTPCRVYDPLLLYGHENLTSVAGFRANDPASGCAFDSLHGYGVVLDLNWDDQRKM